MRAAEFDECRRNNVIGITEVEFGKDGIVLANARQSEHFDVTLPQLFAALAAEVEVNGDVVPNPHTRWSDIDPALPDQEITVIGPPSTSGTRDALIELGMEPGCQAYSAIAALPPDRRDAVCTTIRRDAHFITAGEDDNEIVRLLAERPEAFGIFGYSFLEENLGILSGNPIAGVEPDYETIASGDYPLSRSLYLYVKNQHVGEIAGMRAFIAEYTSERAIGEEGYLVDAGLVALPSVERQQARDTAMSLVPMSRPGVDEAAAGTN
jgi:phosphate transport system substrate-binding protein